LLTRSCPSERKYRISARSKSARHFFSCWPGRETKRAARIIRWPFFAFFKCSIRGRFSSRNGDRKRIHRKLLHFVALEPASAVEGFHCRGEPDHSSSLLRRRHKIGRSIPSTPANADAVPPDKRCCAVATASAVVIDPGGRCHVLATVWSCAWGVGQAIGLVAEHGGHHGQRRQRLSAIFLFSSIRHGDCPRGRESAYLMQPLPA
jgi:hypothetical protein